MVEIVDMFPAVPHYTFPDFSRAKGWDHVHHVHHVHRHVVTTFQRFEPVLTPCARSKWRSPTTRPETRRRAYPRLRPSSLSVEQPASSARALSKSPCCLDRSIALAA